MTVRLTIRRLEAMQGAVSAMLAGEVGQGDWPDGVTWEDMDAAETWIRDSDGSGEAGETGTGSTEGNSAAPEGIAQSPAQGSHHAN